MIFLDLILNLSLLAALSIVSSFIKHRWGRPSRWDVLLQGVLFGGVAVLGMLRPLNFGPGLIFDGRSIMVSLCALFFGPWAVTVAGLMTITCRIWIGGVGTITGSLVILISAAIGLVGHFRLNPEVETPSIRRLYLFGLVVHLAMLALMFTLPAGAGLSVVMRIGLPVVLLYPLATVLVGKILSDQLETKQIMVTLRDSEKRLITAQRIAKLGDFTWDSESGEVTWSDTLFDMLQYDRSEKMDFAKINKEIHHPDDLERIIQWLNDSILSGKEVLTPNEYRIFRKDGGILYVRTVGFIERKDGKSPKIFATVQDITDQKRSDEALKDSKTFLSTLIRTIPDLVWLKDRQGAYLACNSRFESFFGAEEKDIIGKTDYDFFDKEAAEFFRKHDKEAIAKGQPTRNEEEVIFTDDGHREILETIKTPMYTSDGQLAGVLGIGRDITERKRTEDALRESEERFKRAFANIPDVVVIYDKDLRIRFINEATTRITGRPESDFIGKREEEIWPPDVYNNYMPMIRDSLNTGTIQSIETEIPFSHGKLSYLKITCVPLLDETGNVREILGITTDLTKRKKTEVERLKLETALRQTQKMESIGNLAGGVAHDYNNILSIIIGYAELALEKVDPGDSLHSDLKEIFEAAMRSTNITRQLLAFARQQTIAPKVLDLNDTVESMLKMLRRLIGEDIDLAWLPETDLWPVKIDPSQVDQILANLCVNARDAIAGVGKVTIETENTGLDEAYCADHPGFVPGEYVLFTVSDDGIGIAPEILDKIFEPFFTTKGIGKGTGLGLSTVYGIVKQNNGFINVYSEPKQGTSIKIYLPRHTGPTVEEYHERAVEIPLSRGETVLYVEDEGSILKLARRILASLGYTVLTATAPGEAMGLAKEHAGKIHLLITDVIMPEMNGRELSEQLQLLYPDLKILFTSGYTANVIAHRGILEEDVCFIPKPFSKKDLAVKIREVLDNADI